MQDFETEPRTENQMHETECNRKVINHKMSADIGRLFFKWKGKIKHQLKQLSRPADEFLTDGSDLVNHQFHASNKPNPSKSWWDMTPRLTFDLHWPDIEQSNYE